MNQCFIGIPGGTQSLIEAVGPLGLFGISDGNGLALLRYKAEQLRRRTEKRPEASQCPGTT